MPTVILASRDDPVVPFAMYSHWPMSSRIQQFTTSHGGHLGFLGRGNSDPDGHWMDWRICDWIGAAN